MTTAALPEKVFFAPVEAASGAELRLSLQELMLTGKVLPVGAHLWVRHLFRSAESNPVEAVYTFALPRDAALRRFRVVGQGFSVESSLQPVAKAEEIYEEALSRGNLATMARAYRDGLVSLYVGNLKPEETVVVFLELLAGVDLWDSSFRFRFPFTLSPCYHPQARAAEVAPGVGEMELPESFEGVLLPQWVKNGEKLHQVGLALEVWVPQGAWELNSPSHRVRVEAGNGGTARVSLGLEADVPDRDLVLDVRAPQGIRGTFGGARGEGSSVAVVLPSTFFGERPQTSRKDVVFVLDRSGSMDGKPLEQAKKAVGACLAALEPQDRFALVVFESGVELLGDQLMPATTENRRKAEQYLARVTAEGGTELGSALDVARKLLPEGGEVFLVTDGEVFGTEAIVGQAKRAGVRIHCLGIGAASQDRFLAALATHTDGVCHFLTPRERVDMAALELFASCRAPVARELAARSNHVELAPAVPKTVFAGKPVVLFATWEGEKASLELSWKSGDEIQRSTLALETPTDGLGETVYLLQGAKRISELEAEGEELTPALRRQLEELGRRYGLANRALALVAVVTRPGDSPGEPPKTLVVPVGMPEDTLFGAYFRFSGVIEPIQLKCLLDAVFWAEGEAEDEGEKVEAFTHKKKPLTSIQRKDRSLSSLAWRLASDRGIPGLDEEQRWFIAAVVLLQLAYDGHNQEGEELYPEYRRLLDFLKVHPATLASLRRAELVARLEAGEVFDGPWKEFLEDWFEGKPIEPLSFWRSLPIP